VQRPVLVQDLLDIGTSVRHGRETKDLG
jgi:hypothetical protein